MEEAIIKEKMQELVNKWKGKETPLKFTNEYWRYRADQNLYLVYKDKLASLAKNSDT